MMTATVGEVRVIVTGTSSDPCRSPGAPRRPTASGGRFQGMAMNGPHRRSGVAVLRALPLPLSTYDQTGGTGTRRGEIMRAAAKKYKGIPLRSLALPARQFGERRGVSQQREPHPASPIGLASCG